MNGRGQEDMEERGEGSHIGGGAGEEREVGEGEVKEDEREVKSK